MDTYRAGFIAGQVHGWRRGFAAVVIVALLLVSVAALLACAPSSRAPPPAPRLVEDLARLEQRVVALAVLRDDEVAQLRRAVLLGGAVVCGTPYRDEATQSVRRAGCAFVPMLGRKAARLETSVGPPGPRGSR